jgi:hypothetical protein
MPYQPPAFILAPEATYVLYMLYPDKLASGIALALVGPIK